jgi:hypothetical protein
LTLPNISVPTGFLVLLLPLLLVNVLQADMTVARTTC